MVEVLIKITVFLLAVVFTVPIAKYLKLVGIYFLWKFKKKKKR